MFGYQIFSMICLFVNIRIYFYYGLSNHISVRDVPFCIGYVLLDSFIGLSINMLLALTSRIKLIRKILNQSSEDDNEKIVKMKMILILHDKFCDILVNVNKSFSFLFLLMILEFNFHCITISFSFYNIIFNDPSFRDVIFLAAISVLILPRIVFVACILILSGLIKNEKCKIFSAIQCSKIDSQKNMKILKLLELSSLQLDHRTLNVSCGFFTVDWKYLFGIISSIFSTLVILVQFDTSEMYKK